jgi:hypothetical protein
MSAHACRLAVALLAAALGPPAATADPPANVRLIAQRLPRIMHREGVFLRHPTITTVTFAGEEPKIVDRLEQFGDVIAQSGWWREVTDGYCVTAGDCIGPGRSGRHVRLSRALPARVRDVDVEKMLDAEATSGALSGLGPDALVLVYLPRGVRLSDAFHARYCGDGPRAFHRMLRTRSTSFPFAVIPRCGDEAETTATASHEILEAVTNPDPQRPGFRLDPATTMVAFTAYGTEPVDPCGLLTLDHHRTRAVGFMVQRAWSNRAAERGTDPCVPSEPEQPYVALVPRQPVVRLPSVSATASLLLDAASDRPVTGWTISAVDLTGTEDEDQYVEARLDRSTVAPGDVATLTLRVVRLHPRRMAFVGVLSRLGGETRLWPIAVSMR